MRFLFSRQKYVLLLGEAFSTEKWWSVDLKAICKVYLVRVVTDANYEPKDLRNLLIRVVGKMVTLNFIPSIYSV